MDVFNCLVGALPKLRTKLQLSGLVVTVAAFVITRLAAPSSVPAQICAGAVGIPIIVFAQLFEHLHQFPEQRREQVFLEAIVVFCIFLLALLIATIRFAKASVPSDSIAVTIADDRTVRANVQYLAQLDGYTVDFTTSCRESFLDARVQSATLKGKSTLELIDLVGLYLKKPQLKQPYSVAKLPDRGMYAIMCKG